ncbi:MAG: FHA domain-containing protein [Solirubrobacteraceae bacterium]
MTIHAQLTSRPHTPDLHLDHPTHRMAANHPYVVDAYDLLEHRTRERTLPEAGAPAGRYLAVECAGETRLLALERPITHIGRGLVADVRLSDAHVSRRHAIIALRGDAVRVLDDRSSNGTFVNGRRVTSAELADGDVLRFGRATLRYVEVARHRRSEPLRRIPLARRGRCRNPEGAAA